MNIITIANLYPTKGIDILLRAVVGLSVHVTVIGEGPEKEKLKALRDKLDVNVAFIGAKENAKQYLKDFDLFVLPSRKEGFPYVILEAMAAGIPIVCTDVCEAIEDGKNGRKVPKEDVEALRKAIEDTIADPVRAKEMAEQAKKDVLQYSVKNMVEKTVAVYKNLLEEENMPSESIFMRAICITVFTAFVLKLLLIMGWI